MKKEEVYGHIDHTLLKAFSTTEQIEAIAEEALKYGTASICIPASFVNYIHNKYKDVNICTVIGFPLGYSTTSIKVAEAKQAIADGANEIDMLIIVMGIALNNKRISGFFERKARRKELMKRA